MASERIVTVKADTDGKRILMRFPYDLGTVAKISTNDKYADAGKGISGAHWSSAQKCWMAPLTLATCYRMRQVLGEALEIGPALRMWSKATIARDKALAEIANERVTFRKLTRLKAAAPELHATLRADQRVAARWLAMATRTAGGGLLADVPGLGKTLEVLAGILEAGIVGPILVSSPRLAVTRVWLKEIRKWTGAAVFQTRGGDVKNTRLGREAALAEGLLYAELHPNEPTFILVNAEMVRAIEGEVCTRATCQGMNSPDEFTHTEENHRTKKVLVSKEFPALFEVEWACVVNDESHKYLGSLTIAKANQAGTGFKHLRRKASIACTGTPFGKGGRVKGMFGTLHWLRPEEYTSFWRWAETYLEVSDNGYGKTVGGHLADNEDSFFRSIGPVLIRRTKAELGMKLPPKQYVEVECELTGKQKKLYERFIREGEANGLAATGVLDEIMRLRQLAVCEYTAEEDGKARPVPDGDSGKFDALWELLEERAVFDSPENGTKMIIFSQFKEVVNELERRLKRAKVPVYRITGDENDKRRDEQMEAFQADPLKGVRVFLMTTQAGGVSVTLDNADDVFFIDEMWNPEDNEQAEDRAWRNDQSRVHNVTIYYLRTQETIDEYIQAQVIDKGTMQRTVLDARRGVEIARSSTKRKVAA